MIFSPILLQNVETASGIGRAKNEMRKLFGGTFCQ